MRSSHLVTAKPWLLVVLTVLLMRVAQGADPVVARVLALALIGFWSWYFLQLGNLPHSMLSGAGETVLRRFKIGIGYVFVYLASIIWFPSDEFLLNNYHPGEYGWRWTIVPLGVLWLYAVFQTIYQLSRWMSACRKGDGHEEHWGPYLLLFWFCPVGIFVVQPRLVALLKHT